MSLCGHAEWCPHKGEPPDAQRSYCSTCTRSLGEQRDEVELYREALQEIADIEGDGGPGRIAADALRASGIDPFSEAGKR